MVAVPGDRLRLGVDIDQSRLPRIRKFPPPTIRQKSNFRVGDDPGVESLWSTRGRLWRSTAACSLKAGPDSRHELLEVALAPDVLPQLRRDRVGCMLVVARMP